MVALTQEDAARMGGLVDRYDDLPLGTTDASVIAIAEREERASIAIATNLPFSEWGAVFPDPRLVAAIVDRVTFNAHILETGTQSYRLRTSKNTRRKAS
jgi:DNA replication protein DnaC